jgi:putative sigma-54 modulation protein
MSTPIQFTGLLKIKGSDQLRTLTTEKFSRLYKLASNITSIHVTFNVDKLRHIAEASIHIPKLEIIHAKAESEDMYKTVDLLINKLIRQLAKFKEKATDHS